MDYRPQQQAEKSKLLNMPKIEREMFAALFNAGEFSWSGLAELFCERYGESDVKEFISLLETENSKRN